LLYRTARPVNDTSLLIVGYYTLIGCKWQTHHLFLKYQCYVFHTKKKSHQLNIFILHPLSFEFVVSKLFNLLIHLWYLDISFAILELIHLWFLVYFSSNVNWKQIYRIVLSRDVFNIYSLTYLALNLDSRVLVSKLSIYFFYYSCFSTSR
jgi:hypothetical protein